MNLISAETNYEDMSQFTKQILLEHCDQSDQIKIVRFKNSNTGKDAFCVEPYVDYKPDMFKYQKQNTTDSQLSDFYHAYVDLGKTDEAFITIQLMIWEYVSGDRFTFDDKDASDYLQDEVLALIESYQNNETETIELTAKLNEELIVPIENLNKYSVSDNNMNGISISENEIKLISKDLNDKNILLAYDSKNIHVNSFLYHSNKSQDLYSFEGDYETVKDIRLNVKTVDDNLSVSYQKLDMNNNPIEGAEFTLYELSDEGSEYLYFININSDVNLLDFLMDGDYQPDSLSINLSERYQNYYNHEIVSSPELGYFPFTIYQENTIVKQGRVYVTDDLDEPCKKYKVNVIKSSLTENKDINEMDGLKSNRNYYLCESEPQKGYTYVNKPCRAINTYDDSYKSLMSFYNAPRTYTFNLIKNNPDYTIALNGALFRINYDNKNYLFKTGALNIIRENNSKYLFYRYENSEEVIRKEFDSDTYIEDNVPYGKYYYYQSDNPTVESDKLNNVAIVKEGSFFVENMPYSSRLKLEEIEAPKGYFIEEAEFELSPDITYSEITFRNNRVNSFLILPETRRKIPKTCIGG